MKKSIITILLISFTCIFAFGNTPAFKDESLHYIISYKWGMIHKDAGEATLALKNRGDHYSLYLYAKTKPWADRIYQVRDTLLGTLRKSDFKPLSYAKIAHENGKYGKDVINYTFSGNTATGKCTRYKKDKKGNISTSEKNLNASGPVYDMLSVFYYLRGLDFEKMSEGKTIKATVFSGSKVETLSIRCLGKEKIKLRNKAEREAYHIVFNFTSGGKKKSSDDINTWISTDSSHIPLYLVGSLPVGQVRAYYIP